MVSLYNNLEDSRFIITRQRGIVIPLQSFLFASYNVYDLKGAFLHLAGKAALDGGRPNADKTLIFLPLLRLTVGRNPLSATPVQKNLSFEDNSSEILPTN